mmetsp:Transcript_17119/g.26474  ORF Transcript_17119/g.26474 Transcript_17119/m.26474 type:complete len:137 (+) Transcript_17119:513-923(+)
MHLEKPKSAKHVQEAASHEEVKEEKEEREEKEEKEELLPNLHEKFSLVLASLQLQKIPQLMKMADDEPIFEVEGEEYNLDELATDEFGGDEPSVSFPGSPNVSQIIDNLLEPQLHKHVPMSKQVRVSNFSKILVEQ